MEDELWPARKVSRYLGIDMETLSLCIKKKSIVVDTRTPTGHRLFRRDKVESFAATLPEGMLAGEVARYLGVKVPKVSYWATKGKLPFIGRTLAGHKLFDWKTVEALAATTKPTLPAQRESMYVAEAERYFGVTHRTILDWSGSRGAPILNIALPDAPGEDEDEDEDDQWIRKNGQINREEAKAFAADTMTIAEVAHRFRISVSTFENLMEQGTLRLAEKRRTPRWGRIFYRKDVEWHARSHPLSRR